MEVQAKYGLVPPAKRPRTSREPLTNLGNGHPGSQPGGSKGRGGASPNTNQFRSQQTGTGGRSATQMINDSSASAEPISYRDDGTRTVGLPGHLKSIELVDFMCHHHMQMEFNPHVTFVSGSNGSGKSATLQALQCSLGVVARKTGRATSQKCFIRTGAQEAIIRVTIWNKPYFGKDAFQHERYGDSITVERRISLGSYSSWALKDSHGRTIARKREDLDSMIAVLGINAANPVTVMTQDTARSFLSGSTNKVDQEKYELYMKCTQLGTIAENLAEAKIEILEMEAHVGKIKEAYTALVDNRDQLKKQVEDLEGIADWRDEQEEVEKLLAWSCVASEEKALAELQAKLDAIPDGAEELQAFIESLEREVATLTETVATKRSFLENFEKNSEEKALEETAAKAEVKKCKANVSKLTKKIQDLESTLHEEEDYKESLTQAAQLADEVFSEDAVAVQNQFLREMEAAGEKLQEVNAKVTEMQGKKDEAEGAVRDASQEVDIAQRAIQARKYDVDDLQKQLSEMRKNAKSKTSVHMFGGQNMVRMVEEVNKAISGKQFHRNPIGPVGRYLELTDSRWGRAIEGCLYYSMHTFLAHDQHDMQILNKIIQSCNFHTNARPNICVMNLDLPQHTVPANAQPQANVTTVFRVLKVNDPNFHAPVMNFLVDQGRVECIALATSYEHGKTLVRERNVSTVFEVDGSKRYKRGMTESHEPLPQYMLNQPVRLGATAKDQTAEIEKNLSNAKQELADAMENATRAKQLEKDAIDAAREARFALVTSRQEQNKAKAQVDLIKAQQPPELNATKEQNEAGQDDVRNDIFQATQSIMECGNKIEEKRQRLGEAEAALADAQAAAETIRAEHERLKTDNEEYVSSFEASVKQRDEKKAELEEKKAEQDEQSAERAAILEEIQAQKESLSTALATATETVCDREEGAALRAKYEEKHASKAGTAGQDLEKFFTMSFLTSKYERLAKKIAAAERAAGGTLFDKQEEFKLAEEKLQSEGAHQKAACDLFDRLASSFRYREKKFKEVDEAVEQNVNQRFRSYMQRKGHLGKLKIDRSNRQLSLAVQIGKDGVGNEKIKDLKQLSGGERSYTTVAFTLALGSTTEMPFRAMDEFDVFMDSINRRIAMENLLQFAKEQPDLQFVLLTPQDMAAVDEAKKGCAKVKIPIPDDFVKIVAMKKPREDASTA
jgi:structural maintenance of chromosomes protein 6